jgi:hypothetical protein
MRHARAASLLLLMLVGCIDEGPFYRITSLSERDGRDELILAEWSQRTGVWYPYWLIYGDSPRPRYEYHFAALDGQAIAHAELLARCRWFEEDRFIPVQGTQRDHVRIHTQEKPSNTISISRISQTKDPQQLARFEGWGAFELSSATAFAVTRDGRHLLVVDEQSVKITNTGNGSAVEESPNQTLLTIRREMVKSFGTAGTWWLSQDLSHVIIASPEEDTRMGSGTPEVTWLVIEGVRFRADSQGLVYNRKTRALTPFALESRLNDQPLEVLSHRIRVCDAEFVDGRVLLLYTGGPGRRTLVLATPDMTEQHVGRIEFSDREPSALVSIDWRPEQSMVRLLECEQSQKLTIPHDNPPDWCIHTWSYATGAIQKRRIEGAAVRRAVQSSR